MYYDIRSDNWDGIEWLVGSAYNVDMLDKGMIRIPSGMECNGIWCYSEGHRIWIPWIVHFWNFPFNIFRLQLTMGKWNWEVKPGLRVMEYSSMYYGYSEVSEFCLAETTMLVTLKALI